MNGLYIASLAYTAIYELSDFILEEDSDDVVKAGKEKYHALCFFV